MSIELKYGKLAQSDIEPILLLLPQLAKERQELQALIEQHPENFAEKFLTTGFAWAHLKTQGHKTRSSYVASASILL